MKRPIKPRRKSTKRVIMKIVDGATFDEVYQKVLKSGADFKDISLDVEVKEGSWAWDAEACVISYNEKESDASLEARFEVYARDMEVFGVWAKQFPACPACHGRGHVDKFRACARCYAGARRENCLTCEGTGEVRYKVDLCPTCRNQWDELKAVV